MSDINFEALGRCEHLREQISMALSKRDSAFASICGTYHPTDSPSVYDTVALANMKKLQDCFEAMDRANTEVTTLIGEFNRWAGEAGQRPIECVGD